jgi:hypothetical protein
MLAHKLLVSVAEVNEPAHTHTKKKGDTHKNSNNQNPCAATRREFTALPIIHGILDCTTWFEKMTVSRYGVQYLRNKN